MRRSFGLILFVLTAILALGGVLMIFGRSQPEAPQEGIVRAPAVAGAFYPQKPQALADQLGKFLAAVPPGEEKEERLRILIVPHAGYDYSGQVAANGFSKIKSGDFSTVVVIGASHQASFEGAAIYPSGAWETPLGGVGVNEDLAAKLVDPGSLIFESREAHRSEHSLEVELPFLQKILLDFKIVPILMGQSSDDLVEKLAENLAQNIDKKTLVVISSDLSHYPAYDDAVEEDQETIGAILSGQVKVFEATISAQTEKNVPGLVTRACGAEPIEVGMRLAKRLGLGEVKLIDYANSGDTAGDKSGVVGYAAIGFYERQPKAQNRLLEIAWETLESYVRGQEIPPVEAAESELNEKLGAFVTLKKHGELRGCIGRFEPTAPLWGVVQQMTVAAATEDRRFDPVRPDELGDIRIEISVLSPLQKIGDPFQIELGRHGVKLQNGGRSGVFLPQVAAETGWDLETFLGQLCSQKMGLPPDCWRDSETKVYVFTADVFGE